MQLCTKFLCLAAIALLSLNTAIAGEEFLLIGPVIPVNFPIDHAHPGLAAAFWLEFDSNSRLKFSPVISYSWVPFDDYTPPGSMSTLQDVHAINYWFGLDIHYYLNAVDRSSKWFLLAGLGFNKMKLDSRGYGGFIWGSSGVLDEETGLMISLGGGFIFGQKWLVTARIERATSTSHCTEIPVMVGMRI